MNCLLAMGGGGGGVEEGREDQNKAELGIEHILCGKSMKRIRRGRQGETESKTEDCTK